MTTDVNGYEIKNGKNAAGDYVFSVFAPDKLLVGTYKHDGSAHQAANRHFLKGKVTTRKCLCCETKFTSTGAHHRMCGLCRTKSGGLI